MIKILNFIYSILDKKQKTFFLYITFLSFIAMIFETFTIVSIMSVLNLFSDINTNALLNKIQTFLNIDEDSLVKIIILIAGSVFVVKTVFLIYFIKILLRFIEEVKVDQSNNLFLYYLNQPFIFHVNKNSSELLRNLTEAPALGLIIRTLVDFILEFIVLIGLIIFLIYLNLLITFISILIFLFFSAIFYFFINKRAQKWGIARKESAGNKLKKLQQGFAAIRDIKILNKEKFFSDSFSYSNKIESENTYNNAFFSSLPKILFELVCILLVIIVFYYIFFEKKDIVHFLPIISAYAFAAYRLIPSVIKILNANQTLKYWFPVTEPYIEKSISYKNNKNNEKIKNNNNLNEIKNVNFLKSENNHIKFKNVNFNFKNRTNFVLKKINLEFNKNDFIGIFGESGSGKTTFVNLLLGLYQPVEGQILFGEKSIFQDLKSWRKLLSFIPQNIYILDDTVIKNVAFGHENEKIDIERVKHSLKKANAYEFVNSLENKLHTNCGELGEFLSGGQRQRIAIARALYNDSKILVFDEFTNFLDSDNEKKIMNEISNLKNKTRIIVSHKKSTLNFCNKLFEIKDNTLIKKL